MREKFLYHISALGTGIFALILILFAYLSRQERLSAQILLMLILTSVIGWGIKLFHKKKRPDFDPKTKWNYSWPIRKMIEIDEQSFPSLHAARSTGLLIVLGNHLPSLKLIVFLGILAFLVCASKVWLKRHDTYDVIGGIALGTLTALGALFYI